ncbi:hypothetical protein Salat_0659200 [Sesamum alatum]|uniref:Uncharacterized protein n=1 Tax=Sesamum alatum TaxID=300844 RepID=A0AAE1YRR4_9LAMI|nr:hypothetical protein Salat_0659200 [Sesamum alatum]
MVVMPPSLISQAMRLANLLDSKLAEQLYINRRSSLLVTPIRVVAPDTALICSFSSTSIGPHGPLPIRCLSPGKCKLGVPKGYASTMTRVSTPTINASRCSSSSYLLMRTSWILIWGWMTFLSFLPMILSCHHRLSPPHFQIHPLPSASPTLSTVT